MKTEDFLLTPLQAGTNVHMTIILGLPAIILLAIGTGLYYYSKEKYTFAHGVCAGLSLLLTTINVYEIIPMTMQTLPGFDIFHTIHIGLGIIGYIFGIIAFITGISGVRVHWPGLIALVCWSAVFVMGYIQYIM